jgi:lysophospholipase L1-like esterase
VDFEELIMRYLCCALLVFLPASVVAQDIVIIGDSLMDWNEERSIPALLSKGLGVPVDNRSIAGAELSAGFWNRWDGLDIKAQLGSDKPSLLVMAGGGNEFSGCASAFHTLAERLETMPDVTYVSVSDAINSNDLTLYDTDRVHPSAKGSSVMATLLAESIRELP